MSEDKFHNLGGAVDLRSLTQPEQQFFIIDTPAGKRQAFPLVAVSFFSDSALATLTNVIVTRIFEEAERRGLILSQGPEPEQKPEEPNG